VSIDTASVLKLVESTWQDDVVPALTRYIAIPSLSPMFDASWREHGHIDDAVKLISGWCRVRPVEGMTFEVVQLPDRTPMIVIEVAPFGGGDPDDTVVLYGHLDKQPEMTGWREGLGPWTPVREGDRLYGRGGADDGYAVFASLAAIEACQRAGGRHTRLVVLIEASEESGSPDLPAYVDHLATRIATPSLVVCLDSGCLTYDRMWLTTSLRGLVSATLSVQVLLEGAHSGEAGGVVPSSFRLVRQLLDRLEDSRTGELRLPELYAQIPEGRVAEAKATASELPSIIADSYRFAGGTQPMKSEPSEGLLARTWQPALAVTGADGLPPTSKAGNVLRPSTSLHLSLRIPPTVDDRAAIDAVVRTLTTDPPEGAVVTVDHLESSPGWNAPATAPWLTAATEAASQACYGNGARWFGEGGSIPFMGMLGSRFPEAQFAVTGALGPGANAHGPNEYLHVPMATRLTGCIALLLDAHARR
jgi:acetylornithine deacetylase/succinyl-diaminopimelate desuccinylase-like protein